MPVEHGPVDEEEPLLRARLAGRLADVARLAPANRCEAAPLREDRRTRAGRARRGRCRGRRRRRRAASATPPAAAASKRSARAPVEDPPEDRIAGQHARCRASLDLLPRRRGSGERRPARPSTSRRRERLDEACERMRPREAPPARRSRAVRLPSPGDLGGQRLESALDLAADDRVAEDWGRSSRGRAQQEVERQRRAPGEVADRRAARRSSGRSTRRSRSGRRARASVRRSSSASAVQPASLQAPDEEPVDVHPDRARASSGGGRMRGSPSRPRSPPTAPRATGRTLVGAQSASSKSRRACVRLRHARVEREERHRSSRPPSQGRRRPPRTRARVSSQRSASAARTRSAAALARAPSPPSSRPEPGQVSLGRRRGSS